MTKTIALVNLVAICVLVRLSAGCAELPEYEDIDKLRILAIRADKPQISVDETVVMDALVVTPTDEAVRYAWQLCAYVRGPETKRSCPKQGLLKAGKEHSFSFSIDDQTFRQLSPLCDGGDELLDMLPEGATVPECIEAGYPLIVRLTAETEKERQVSIKRVFIHPDPPDPRFTNPMITGFKNLPVAVTPNETYIFSVKAEASGDRIIPDDVDVDAGSDSTAEGLPDQADELRYSWFVVGADADYLHNHHNDDEKKDRVHLKVEKDAKRVTAWSVVRNMQYGVDWRRLDFEVK